MVEYRGYGDSDSVTPSEEGLKLDGQAALKFILKHPKMDSTKIFLFGRSLGGAVALDLALYAEHQNLPLAGVIVENTFTSISNMVDHLMPYVAPLKNLVLRIGWDSLIIVPHLSMPVLYLAGAQDQLVPHAHMLQLYKSTKRSRWNKLHVIPEGTHNETWMQGGQDYWDAIRSFLLQAVDATNTNTSSSSVQVKGVPTPMTETTTPFGSVLGDVAATATTTTISSAAAGSSSSSSAIPIMPSRLLGLARESMRDGSASMETPSKKEL
jgi:pimeloyl-ACP methyl ester carboxylesterase